MIAERARAAFAGLAVGDALGMPTQLLSAARVREIFGSITGFVAPTPDHPIAAGLAAGSVTDDTEQALLVARLIIDADGDRLDPVAFAHALVAWEDAMRARGSLDLLGPSTSRAVRAVLDGEPIDRAGRFGATNGAAMRITPVGIAVPPAPLPALVDAVVDASFVTHNTGLALAGAAAVAAAVSAGIEGADAAAATEHAIAAARLAADRGHWIAGADVAERIAWSVDLASTRPVDEIAALVGTSLATQESVPLAFAIVARYPGDAWGALCAAASVGGDSDTVAAIAGAIAGATGAPVPPDAVATVEQVNGLSLAKVADRLLELRRRS